MVACTSDAGELEQKKRICVLLRDLRLFSALSPPRRFLGLHFRFGLRHSSFFRHSSFDIRHFPPSPHPAPRNILLSHAPPHSPPRAVNSPLLHPLPHHRPPHHRRPTIP